MTASSVISAPAEALLPDAGRLKPGLMPAQQPANSGALAVLADVAGNAREEMEVATQLKVRVEMQSVCAVLRFLCHNSAGCTLWKRHEPQHASSLAPAAKSWNVRLAGRGRSH